MRLGSCVSSSEAFLAGFNHQKSGVGLCLVGETPAGMFLWFGQLSSLNVPFDLRASL